MVQLQVFFPLEIIDCYSSHDNDIATGKYTLLLTLESSSQHDSSMCRQTVYIPSKSMKIDMLCIVSLPVFVILVPSQAILPKKS